MLGTCHLCALQILCTMFCNSNFLHHLILLVQESAHRSPCAAPVIGHEGLPKNPKIFGGIVLERIYIAMLKRKLPFKVSSSPAPRLKSFIISYYMGKCMRGPKTNLCLQNSLNENS